MHIEVASNEMETFQKIIKNGNENIICFEHLLPFLTLTLLYWWDIKIGNRYQDVLIFLKKFG